MVCGDVHHWRQLLVLCGVCMYSYGCGLVLAFPAVLNPDLLSPNGTIKASADEVSWIAACHGLSGFLGVAIFSPIFQRVGRKTVNIGINVLVMVGWVIFYFANTVAILMWARLVQGLAIGGVFIIAIALSECSLPSNRGFFITLKKVSLAFGSLTCHSLGLVWNWRHFAAFSALVQFATILVIMLCPESPAYFAITGRYDECRKSFRWLFGHASDTEKDLRDIISAQMKNREEKKREKTCQQISRTANILLKKDFLKPFFIAALCILALDTCGRYFLLAYITQIMIEITGDKSVSMYCSIAGDCLLIFALSLSCYMIKKFTRRTLILKFGFFSVFLMFLVSFTVIIRSYSIISGMAWLTPSVVLLHSFVAHIGLVPVTYAIIFEIFPLEYKGLASFSTGIVFTVIYTLTLKVTPLMITHTGIEGTYAIYGSCVLVCLGLLFFMLPETKDRTLQDIEDEIRGMNQNVNDVQSILINENCSK